MESPLLTRKYTARIVRVCAQLGFGLLVFVTLSACGGAEERMARAMENGEQFLSESNFDKARIEFSNALQIDPNNVDAIYLTGRAAEGLQEYRAAISAYRAALDVDAAHLGAGAAMGRMMLFSGEAEMALEQVEAGLAIDPNNADLITVRAAAHSALGDNDTALADVESVVAANPGHAQAAALLAGLYRSRNETARAIEVTTRAIELNPAQTDLRSIRSQLYQSEGNLDAAEAELLSIIELNPDELAHRNRLARFYLASNRAADAEAILRENIAREPDLLEHKVTLINYLRAQQGYDDAEQQLQAFVAQNPEDANLKLALGQFYQANTYDDDAEAIYHEVIEEAGVSVPALTARNRLAARMLQTNRSDEAVPLIEAVIAENPRDTDALTLRASIALTAGDMNTAITDLRSVLRDQPDNGTVLANLARAHQLNGEPDLALENYRGAMAADPGNSETRLEYAQFLRQRGDLDAAEQLLEAALDLGATDLPTLESMFRVQLAQGNVERAAEIADQAIAANPEHPLGYFLKGQLFEAQQNAEAAMAQYEFALEKEPRGAEPLTGLVRLQIVAGDVAGARQRLSQIKADHPGHAVALNLLAELYVREQNAEAALENFDAAISASPGWWVPYRGKAVLLNSQGDLEAVRDVFATGVEMTNAAPALGIEYAQLLEAAGDVEAALSVYERMYANNPSSDVLSNNFAMLLAMYRDDQDSFDRAYEMIRGFRTSENAAFLDTYGWVRLKQGNVDEAVSYLRRAAEAVPGSAALRYHYSRALFQFGDFDAARLEVAAALEISETFSEADEARELLEQLDSDG